MSVLLTIMTASLGEPSVVRVVLDERFCSNCFELQSKWELKSEDKCGLFFQEVWLSKHGVMARGTVESDEVGVLAGAGVGSI